MPGLGYNPTSVSDQLNRIVNPTNPLMRRAGAQGRATAGRRGLQNSSLATQAGQAAILDVAMPLASQEASQAFTTSERLGAQKFTTSERLGTQKFTTHERLGSQGHATRMQNSQLAAQEKLAQMNIAAQMKQSAAQFAAQMEGQYASLFTALMQNPNLSGEDRDAYMAHFQPCINSTLHDSSSWFYKFIGEVVRQTGRHRDHGECLHRSVIDRMAHAPSAYAPPNVPDVDGPLALPVVDTGRIARGTPCDGMA